MSYATCARWLKQSGSSIRVFIDSIGFQYIEAGHGLNYIFEDGEKIVSRYELEFSQYLRSIGLQFNKDYFRNTRYKTFILSYTGLMDCDYMIYYNNQIYYIEVAGMLKDYKTWYYGNKIIACSKHKEKYRQDLILKESMLKENDLTYFFIFPESNKNNWFDEVKQIIK